MVLKFKVFFFFDILKAFKIKWHDGMIFKLIQFGKSGNVPQLVKSFLKNGKQGEELS